MERDVLVAWLSFVHPACRPCRNTRRANQRIGAAASAHLLKKSESQEQYATICYNPNPPRTHCFYHTAALLHLLRTRTPPCVPIRSPCPWSPASRRRDRLSAGAGDLPGVLGALGLRVPQRGGAPALNEATHRHQAAIGRRVGLG